MLFITERMFVFNIIESNEIIASIIFPKAESTWKIIDFCSVFMEEWYKINEEWLKRENQKKDFKEIALLTIMKIGGYQSVLDSEYMAEVYPKISFPRKEPIFQKSPCIILNPELIKFVQKTEGLMRVIFGVKEQKLFFINVFREYENLEELNTHFNTKFYEEEIPTAIGEFDEESIPAKNIKDFNDWLYYCLEGFDMDDIKGEDVWLFKQKNNKIYQIIS